MKKDMDKDMIILHKSFVRIGLAVNMVSFLCLCSDKKELGKLCHKISDAHEKLQDSVQNALENRKTESSLIRRNADTFFNKLDTFKHLPAAKDKRLKTLIKEMQEATRELIA